MNFLICNILGVLFWILKLLALVSSGICVILASAATSWGTLVLSHWVVVTLFGSTSGLLFWLVAFIWILLMAAITLGVIYSLHRWWPWRSYSGNKTSWN